MGHRKYAPVYQSIDYGSFNLPAFIQPFEPPNSRNHGKPGTLKMGFPKIRGTKLGVPIIRTIVYWGLYWVPLI